jgi:hypothetical protein
MCLNFSLPHNSVCQFWLKHFFKITFSKKKSLLKEKSLQKFYLFYCSTPNHKMEPSNKLLKKNIFLPKRATGVKDDYRSIGKSHFEDTQLGLSNFYCYHVASEYFRSTAAIRAISWADTITVVQHLFANCSRCLNRGDAAAFVETLRLYDVQHNAKNILHNRVLYKPAGLLRGTEG